MIKSAFACLAILSVLLLGCNDKESLSTNFSSSTDLSAAEDYGTLTVTSIDEGKPVTTETLTPIVWDGKSKIEPGKFYVFTSEELALKAYADDPVQLKIIVDLNNAAKAEKNKQKGNSGTNLASYSTSADVSYSGSTFYVNCYSEHSAGITGTKVHHFRAVRLAPSYLLWADDSITYTDLASHAKQWDLTKSCYVCASCVVGITLNGVTQSSAEDGALCCGE